MQRTILLLVALEAVFASLELMPIERNEDGYVEQIDYSTGPAPLHEMLYYRPEYSQYTTYPVQQLEDYTLSDEFTGVMGVNPGNWLFTANFLQISSERLYCYPQMAYPDGEVEACELLETTPQWFSFLCSCRATPDDLKRGRAIFLRLRGNCRFYLESFERSIALRQPVRKVFPKPPKTVQWL